MKIDVNGDKVSLQIDGTFTAEELANLVLQIGEARMQVAKDGDTPEQAGRANLVLNSRYWTIRAQDGGGSMLFFRLPTTGWTGVTLPNNEVANLIGYLAGHLATGAAAASAGTSGDQDKAAPTSGGGGFLH